MTAPPIQPRAEVRPEIQALRAVAVLIVLVCHYWPRALPGGFVGVDVFFAISGYLITSHLLREVNRTGTVSLVGFWARRARRILPAALLVLLFCAAGTAAWVPQVHWSQYFAEIRASALYVQNWQLAHDAVDYFASMDAPSPVQHYWSLSVEEQFYLVWPLLIVLAAAIHRRLIGLVLGAVTVASLAYSIHKTASDPAAAYFITPTRMWELGLGGLLAMVRTNHGPAGLRAAVSWLGLAAIGVATAVYSSTTPFPGIAAALPVLGGLAVMWAGSPSPLWAASRVLALAPVQYVGDISYSIYLWHWPLLILAPYAIVGGVPRGLLAVLALVLAALTKRFVEDPVRRGPLLTGHAARWTFASAAVASGLVLAASAEGTTHVQHEIQKAERVSKRIVASSPRCFGAASRDPGHPCHNAALKYMVVPTPAVAHEQRNAPCGLVEAKGYLYVCSFGVTPKKAKRTVVLIGDSHAAHWRAALEVVAKQRGWYGLSLSHTGCPLSTTVYASLKPPLDTQCKGWNREVQQFLRQHKEISTVIVSAIAGGVRDTKINAVAGYLGAWDQLPATVQNIVVIHDTPHVRGDTDDCISAAIAAHHEAGVVCKVPRSEATATDPEVVASKRYTAKPVQVVDMTDHICDAHWCYPVVGGALVYRDQNHLTPEFARTLAPYLDKAITIDN